MVELRISAVALLSFGTAPSPATLREARYVVLWTSMELEADIRKIMAVLC
jgi:hypothetical protein